MDIKLLALYFVIGGGAVAATTYFGSQGRGMLAAFIGVLPSVTLITISAIYIHGGAPAATSYLRGLLFFMAPWIVYILAVLPLLPRIRLAGSLSAGVVLYLIGAFIILRLFPSG